MAIAAKDLVDKFGTQTVVDSGATASVLNASFSASADQLVFTNTDDVPNAVFVLSCQWAVLPTDNSVINLYARKLNVDGVNDTAIPDAANLDQYIGAFVADGTVAVVTTAFLTTAVLALPNHVSGQQYEFYIENQSGQTISAGWTLKLTPLTIGPK